jgi:pilus assembly protein CpaE
MEIEEKIRVLIVDDITETRENIRKLLQFESDVEVVGAARSGREAINIAKETKPDVILMDINMPDMDGITATEHIKQHLPFSQIIILSVQSDSNYMRRAMVAGADDFLAKPPTIEELTSAVRRAAKKAKEERTKAVPLKPPVGITGPLSPLQVAFGKVVMVYSPKGGTGCTTIATNLAVTLHNTETPVVLVDANLQFGDLVVFLNEQGKNSIADLAPRVDELDDDVVNEVLISHKDSGVKILMAPARPQDADSVTGEQFGKIIRYLTQMFSYVIVDTPSVINEHVLSAIDEVDLIVVITTQDIPAIRNVRMFLDLAKLLEVDTNRIVLVMNRYDRRIAITPEKVGESFKHEISSVIPFDERTVLPAVNRGSPFMLQDKTRPISRTILALVEIIRQNLSRLESREENVRPAKW